MSKKDSLLTVLFKSISFSSVTQTLEILKEQQAAEKKIVKIERSVLSEVPDIQELSLYYLERYAEYKNLFDYFLYKWYHSRALAQLTYEALKMRNF